MRVVYGNYSHEASRAGIVISSQVIETDAGVPYLIEQTIDITGKLYNRSGDSRDLDAKIAQLERAYSIPGQDFALLHDNGTRTAHSYSNAQTIGGIRARAFGWPRYQGGEYCTFRSFTVQLAMTFPATKMPAYVRFKESISIKGGGQKFGVKEVQFGPGTMHRLRTHEKCTATQSGSAVGIFDYPELPPPIWPWAQAAEPDITRVEPKVYGNRGTTLKSARTEFEISWSYRFEWPYRLDGRPHYVE